MRKNLRILFAALLVYAIQVHATGQNGSLPSKSAFNFIVISDFGRNGYYNQKEVADMMARVAPECRVKFYVTGGDNFQISGVQSTMDPLWMSSFENIYTHPSSHTEWYPALGNHDHSGNVQAQIEYSNVSRRWKMPAPYYTIVKQMDSVSVRLVILDTQSLVMGLRNSDRPGFSRSNAEKQLAWVDSVLSVAKEQWIIVVGHHPVYSALPSRKNTKELVEYLNPVMNKYHADFYIGSHDHIFQHLKDSIGKIDYFVNTAGSYVRDAYTNEMSIFSASSPGFSICSATMKSLSIYFIGVEGNVIYQYSRSKKEQ
jgi:metallophosphoesterase superfamily enzyme